MRLDLRFPVLFLSLSSTALELGSHKEEELGVEVNSLCVTEVRGAILFQHQTTCLVVLLLLF